MAGIIHKSFDTPEEVRPFEHGTGQLEVLHVKDKELGRATFQPGWQWSKHVKPIAQTDSCQASHAGYVIKGRMHVTMDDGQEDEFGPGDLIAIPPGHDAWVVGQEPCVMVDWQGFQGYAQR